MIKKELVDSLFTEFGEPDITGLSIREVGKLVSQIEEQSGVEFIHMEMGIPGLPASAIAIAAEKEALDKGLATQYPHIEGIPFAKTEIARFAKLFINLDVTPLNCIPTVGGMQGSFAALLAAARTNPEKPYTLFIDPGFPVNKSQLQIIGVPFKHFDILNFRGEKLKEKQDIALRLPGAPAIGHHGATRACVLECGRDPLGGAKHVARYRLPRLDLDQDALPAELDYEVRLGSMLVAVEEDAALFALVGAVLDDLRGHPRFKDGSAERMLAKLVDAADSQ